MKQVALRRAFPALLAAFALAAFASAAASAQSSLDTSEAQAFLGSWSLNMDSPQGAFEMALEITDSSGKVAASVGSDMTGTSNVTNISKSGADLVLRYEFDAQGQLVPVALTLTPNGAELEASMDFADGMFVMLGRATK